MADLCPCVPRGGALDAPGGGKTHYDSFTAEDDPPAMAAEPLRVRSRHLALWLAAVALCGSAVGWRRASAAPGRVAGAIDPIDFKGFTTDLEDAFHSMDGAGAGTADGLVGPGEAVAALGSKGSAADALAAAKLFISLRDGNKDTQLSWEEFRAGATECEHFDWQTMGSHERREISRSNKKKGCPLSPCYHTTEPGFGALDGGDCPALLPTGGSCAQTPRHGYECHPFSCDEGLLEGGDCPPLPCPIGLADSDQADAGDCPEVMEPGTTCQWAAHPGISCEVFNCTALDAVGEGCKVNECTCPDGIPSTGPDCTIDGGVLCEACQLPGFYAESGSGCHGAALCRPAMCTRSAAAHA